MKTPLLILLIWFIVSIPVGLICGKLFHENQKHYPPADKL